MIGVFILEPFHGFNCISTLFRRDVESGPVITATVTHGCFDWLPQLMSTIEEAGWSISVENNECKSAQRDDNFHYSSCANKWRSWRITKFLHIGDIVYINTSDSFIFNPLILIWFNPCFVIYQMVISLKEWSQWSKGTGNEEKEQQLDVAGIIKELGSTTCYTYHNYRKWCGIIIVKIKEPTFFFSFFSFPVNWHLARGCVPIQGPSPLRFNCFTNETKWS